jgi:hypothetical protein
MWDDIPTAVIDGDRVTLPTGMTIVEERCALALAVARTEFRHTTAREQLEVMWIVAGRLILHRDYRRAVRHHRKSVAIASALQVTPDMLDQYERLHVGRMRKETE